MRRILLSAFGLSLVALLGAGSACLAQTVANPFEKKEETTCGKHGTTVALEDSPAEAARKAKKEEKLVMILHVSGLFEDPKLT
jgi:hypothetical protein